MKKIFAVLFVLLILPLSYTYADEATTTPDTASSTPEEIHEEIPAPEETIPDPVDIHLQVEGPETTIFDAPLTVSACTTPNNASSTVNGFCAFEAAELEVNVSWGPFGAFVTGIGGIENDSSNFWLWFLNGDIAPVGIDSYFLEEDDHVMWAIGREPLKISVSDTTPDVGTSFTVTVTGFDPFDFAFEPVANASLIGIGATTTESGTADILATSTEPFTLYAEAEGYLRSGAVTITPSGSTPPPPPPSDGGNSSNDDEFDVPAALAFLAGSQGADGSFGLQLFTDWAAIAYGAGDGGSAESKLRNYLLSATPLLSSVTDYERHAMALMALDINPYTGSPVDSVAPIVAAFDGTQIGSASLENDDIFALFPLLKAGYDENDEIIQDTVAFIVSRQAANGSWVGSVDLTAAAVQALSQVTTLPDVSDALERAETYLRVSQKADGGFGNSFSTSWAMQAIEALGQSQEDWTNGGNTPAEYLASLQESDGGVEPTSADAQTRLWATEFAVPAALGVPWPELLSSFSKPSQDASNQSSGGGGNSNSSINSRQATSTATSTGLVLGEATSTGSGQATTTVSPLPIAPQTLVQPRALSSSALTEPIPNIEAATTSTSTNVQLAAAAESVDGTSGTWMWIAGLLLILGATFYFFRRA